MTEYSDANTEAVVASWPDLDPNGARVRVLGMRCLKCGDLEWLDGEEGQTFTLLATGLRLLTEYPHNDDCDGQILFATEPVEADDDR